MYTIRLNMNGTYHYYSADSMASSETLYSLLCHGQYPVERMY